MQDRKDKTETQDLQGRQGPLGIGVLLAVVDHMDLLDQWASPGIVDRMEKLESQECKESQDLWGGKDLLEIRVLKGHQGQWETQEKMVAMETQDFHALISPLAIVLFLEVQGQKVIKACLDLQAKMGPLVKMDTTERWGHKVLQGEMYPSLSNKMLRTNY